MSAVQQNESPSLALDSCGNILMAANARGRVFISEVDPSGVPRDFRQVLKIATPGSNIDDASVSQIMADPLGGMVVIGSVRGTALLEGAAIRSAGPDHDTLVARWTR
jgi:hypothetical protein